MEYICSDVTELPVIADELLKRFPESKVFAFYGKMGVGKTTFIKAICEALKVKDISNSPSFGIINEYQTEEGHSVFHFDFYRIKNASEFFDLGCEEYMSSNEYCLIEWPEKIEDLLPENRIDIRIIERNRKRIFIF